MRPSEPMMRVAIVNDVAGVARLQAQALQRIGIDAEFIDLPKPGARWPFWAKLIFLPVRLAAYIPVIVRLRRGRYRLVHIHFVSQGVVGAAAGLPFVLQAHGSDLHANMQNPLLRWWGRLWLSRARAIFYVTPNLASLLGEFASKSKLLPNPVDVDRFSPIDVPAGLARVLIFARLEAVKGAAAIFSDIERLASIVEITAIAAGELASDYRNRYSRWVRFIDPVPAADVPELLGRFDAVIGQMQQKVAGLSELEAMAAGRPVFMRLDQGLYGADPPPVISVAGPDELFAAVGRLKADPEEFNRAAAVGREWVRRHHSPEAHAAVLREAYEQLLKGAWT